MRKQFVFVLHGKEYDGAAADAKDIEAAIETMSETYFQPGMKLTYIQLNLVNGQTLIFTGAALRYFHFYTKECV